MVDFTNLKKLGRPVVIGHRGAPEEAHENTLASFEKAITLGVDAVEFDVRRTADGVLVVHHDPRVSRKTPRISKSSWAETQEAAISRGYEIPTLEQVAELCAGRVSLDVELKETGYEAEVVEVVLRRFDPKHVMFKSFREISVKKMCAMEPSLFAGLLLGYRIELARGSGFKKKISPLARVERTGARFVAPPWRLARKGFIRRMHEAGLPVFAWTVNDLRVARRLIRQNVAGMITNRPEKIASVL